MDWPPPQPGTWLLDLDGVVWRTGKPIEGAPEAIAALRRAGNRVVFVTNNAGPTLQQFSERFQQGGIHAEEGEVLGSARAAAGMLRSGERAFVIGEDGIAEALHARAVEIVDHAPVDAVIVSRTPKFDYEQLATASGHVRAGARLIGTSDDPTHPTAEGQLPGTGSLLAAVATAGLATPEVAGKPHPPMVRLVHEHVGRVSVMVGDRPSTDGAMAERLATRFALVLSGVTAHPETVDPEPAAVAPDLLSLVREALG